MFTRLSERLKSGPLRGAVEVLNQVTDELDNGRLSDSQLSATIGGIVKHAPADRILYVSVDGDDGNDGLSFGTALASIQTAVDALAALNGGTVRVGAGTFVEDILVKKRVSIEASGYGVTFIESPPGSTADGVLTLDEGPVIDVHLSGFTVKSSNPGQHGIYFEAAAIPGDPNNNGGLWWSSIEGIRFSGITGDLIWMRGGGDDNLKPHQFISVSDVIGFAVTGKCALRLTGQVGQVDFNSCQFDGPGLAVGSSAPNVFIGREVDDALAVISDIAPYTINFRGCTFQSNAQAIVIQRANVVRMSGVYFENVGQSITVSTSAQWVEIDGVVFANAATSHAADGSGYAVSQAGGARVRVANYVIIGGAEATFKGDSAVGVLDVGPGTSSVGTVVGVTRQLSISGGGAITAELLRTAWVNTSATTLTTITSEHMPGAQLHLRALSGPFTIGTGGNIADSGLGLPLVVQQNQVVTLTKFDSPTTPGAGTWYVTGISGGVSPRKGTAAPASTPAYVGQEFIDTTAKKVYKAVGTSSSSDWVVLN